MKRLNKNTPGSDSSFFKKLFRLFLYTFPLVLFFSYYPLIHFGANESMNFEISLPLIWLVLFDLLLFIMMIRQGVLFKNFRKVWTWLLLPIYFALSVLWSLNVMRGFLVAGIIFLISFAIYGIYSFRDLFDAEFWSKFLKWFFGSTIAICVWCFLQCILDLNGVLRESSLLCEGCTYKSFGFPHPNGFAIEPQFMGNLLLAPAITAVWLIVKLNNKKLRRKSSRGVVFTFFLIIATLFLTFSRGAIYAFMVAMVFLTAFLLVREKGKVLKRVFGVWMTIVIAFLFTLNLQGIMAQVSPTNDTYFSGVSKVLNHLSLGVIDVRGEKVGLEEEQSSKLQEVSENEAVFKSDKEESYFDGYVVESTEIRMKLTNLAMMVWKKDLKTLFFGVGLGGAGQALYVNDLTDSPKEIVQNQYINTLLETGLIGMALVALTLVLIIRAVIKTSNALIVLTLMVAYGVSLLFFSGLPNALQIYLLPMILAMFCEKNQRVLRKKLVS